MKTFTIEEFQELLINNQWEHQAYVEVVDFDKECSDDEFRSTTVPCVMVTYTVESSLGEMQIIHTDASIISKYDLDDRTDPMNLEGYCGDTFPWNEYNFAIVDKNGEQISLYDLVEDIDYCLAIPHKFMDYSSVKYNLVAEVEDLHPIDVDKEVVLLKRLNKPSLRFQGEKLASVDNEYESSPFWLELIVYKTIDNQFVCQVKNNSHTPNPELHSTVAVCDTKDKVEAFFEKHTDRDIEGRKLKDRIIEYVV